MIANIDENNIWAVGEIYMLDSLGNHDPHAYNAVHWDGLNWEMLRIFFPRFFMVIMTLQLYIYSWKHMHDA